jgi:hypothetical protein
VVGPRTIVVKPVVVVDPVDAVGVVVGAGDDGAAAVTEKLAPLEKLLAFEACCRTDKLSAIKNA